MNCDQGYNRGEKRSKIMLQHGESLCNEDFDATLISYLGNKCELVGKLILTDFRCIFLITKDGQYQDNPIKFDFPIGYLSKCQSSSEVINKNMVFYLEMTTKFLFTLKLKSPSPNLSKASELIYRALNTEDLLFGQKRTNLLDDMDFCKKWQFYSTAIVLENSDAAQFDNLNWVSQPLYPSLFKVPKPFVGKRNPTERLVFLTFTHLQKKEVGLWRSGPGKMDPEEEKWVPIASKKSDHIVIEIKNRSLSSSKSHASKCVQMDGPVQMREIFNKMFYSSCYQSEQLEVQQKWLVHINSSRWWEQNQLLLSEAFLVYDKLCEELNVTLLAEWDVRGSQISALAQIIAKPENRTIQGFGNLIERQFLHFGNWVNPNVKREKNEDKGIGLIQFLDCVYQIMSSYPLSFEFNEDMLTYIAIHIYSRKYGNFLFFTCVFQSIERTRIIKSACIWQKINKNRTKFINPFYVSHRQSDIYDLKRETTMKSVNIWASFFFRDILIYGNTLQINLLRQNHRVIHQRHQAARMYTEQLRKKIAQQHKMITQEQHKLAEVQQNRLD